MFARSVCVALCLQLLFITSVHSATQPQQMTVDVPCPAQLQLKVGEKRYIKAYENPSTGYTWSASQSNALFKITDYRQRQMTHLPVVGAGLERIWIFQAVKTGQTTLSLTHGRSWEKQPIQTWQCEVEVLAAKTTP